MKVLLYLESFRVVDEVEDGVAAVVLAVDGVDYGIVFQPVQGVYDAALVVGLPVQHFRGMS